MWQTTDTVLMIRPASFGSNPETVATNAFQHAGVGVTGAHTTAVAEFDSAVEGLRAAGVRVCVVDDTPAPPRPDAVFPNNWISTHDNGTVVLYPMQAPSRRREVRRDVVSMLHTDFGFEVRRTLDLTGWAERGKFLEGTGSMVLDRVSRTAFACRSPRTSGEVLTEFCHELDFAPNAFTAIDASGTPIYHTNVMMWIGTQAAAICFDAVPDRAEREGLAMRIAQGGRTIIPLSHEQMKAFAGNALELRTRDAQPVIAMSARAAGALTDDQRQALEAYARIVAVDLATIETCSGGSMRCMLAELFLPH